nr:DUF5702 domain-containing protein [uncultured Butyrivibrio sp.]
MRSQTKGYITVFLSLSITIILSLVLALYQGARIGTVRMKAECVADIAMNSVLSEYNRELFDQYSLLFVDCSYGRPNPSVVNTREHLRYYAGKNFERSTIGGLSNAQTMTAMNCKDVNLTGYSVATDNEGAVFCRQILAYMAAEPVGGAFTDVMDNAGRLKSAGLDTTDVEQMASENQKRIDETRLPEIENDEGEKETVSIGNPADAVNAQKAVGILNLAIDDRNSISGAAVNTQLLPSKRKLEKGTGLDDTEKLSVSEKLLLDEYFYEKCSRYGNELDKAILKYQLEYLAYGEDSDYKNLEKMAQELLFWREASNMLYLFGCQEKISQAEALAGALSVILMVPELMEPIKYSILFAWTFAESVADLHTLFGGGKIPLLKDDASWKLSIGSMLSFRSNLNSEGGEEGLDYKDYLRMKLFMTDTGKKVSRMMDIVEMDIRNTKGNEYFRLDYCLDVLRAEFVVGTRYGYEASIERTYGYEY